MDRAADRQKRRQIVRSDDRSSDRATDRQKRHQTVRRGACSSDRHTRRQIVRSSEEATSPDRETDRQIGKQIVRSSGRSSHRTAECQNRNQIVKLWTERFARRQKNHVNRCCNRGRFERSLFEADANSNPQVDTSEGWPEILTQP